MDKEIYSYIFEFIVIPLLGVLTTFLVQFLSAKSKELRQKTDNELAQKYLDMITSTVINCVVATNQTYTESLKKEGKFDEEAQKIAFEKTFNAVLTVLSDEAKDYINNSMGDLNVYLTSLIESTVNQVK